MGMPKLLKALQRAQATRRARYAPRGGVSDRRPLSVRTDAGAAHRLVKLLAK